jgi:hypothetical protein
MGSSFTVFQQRGFWAPDTLVEVWLEALADVVAPDSPSWLLDARRHWQIQARTGFQGCVDAGLDGCLTSPDRIQAIQELTARARELLVHLGGPTGRLPVHWLNARRVGGSGTWLRDLGLRPVLWVADTFAELLQGNLQTSTTTSPVLLQLIREQPPS